MRGKASGTVLNGGDQWIHAGGRASGTVINQDGYQTIKHGGLVTGTIVNTGAEGGPDSENVSTGQMVGGLLNPPPSIKMAGRLSGLRG